MQALTRKGRSVHKSERYQEHLAFLRGDIEKDTLFVLDGIALISKIPFNVYLFAEKFSLEIESRGKNLASISNKDPSLIAWLEFNRYVKRATTGTIQYGPYRYAVTPMLPSLREILRTISSLQEFLGEDSIMELSVRDIYVFTIFKDVIAKLKLDNRRSKLENLEEVILKGGQIIDTVYSAWFKTRNTNAVKESIPRMSEIYCFDIVTADKIPAFRHIKTGSDFKE